MAKGHKLVDKDKIQIFLITFNGSPMEAVSYVSVVLDACELSPSPPMFASNFSIDSSFAICSLSPISFITTFVCAVGDLSVETNDSFDLTDSQMLLSASRIVDTDGAAAIEIGSTLLINGASTIDLRPEIGSNRSSIESRGFIWPDGAPRDSRKSKSFEFKITANETKNKQFKLVFFHNNEYSFFKYKIRVNVERKREKLQGEISIMGISEVDLYETVA